MNANWFAAHVILWVKYTEHKQKTFPLWENVILIRAQSAQEAFAKAEAHGHRMAGKGKPTFSWSGKPAMWVFGGVRKVTACDDAEERPDDGGDEGVREPRRPRGPGSGSENSRQVAPVLPNLTPCRKARVTPHVITR